MLSKENDDHQMFDINLVRNDTPGINYCIHFNNCSSSLMPIPVIYALKNFIDLEARIGGYEAETESINLINNTYSNVAALLRCSLTEVAIVENATRAWDMLFYSVDFKKGDKILTSVSEYASNFIAFLQLQKKVGLEVFVVPNDNDGQLDTDELEKLIDDKVKLIAVTHVPTNGGLVNPAKEIGKIAQHYGVPFLLDACQSVGHLPINVEEMGADMLSGTSRKYLRGPRGVGFLSIRKSRIKKIIPPFLDLYAAKWISRNQFTIRNDAKRFENWESNVAAKIAFGVAVEYALDLGIESISQRIVHLASLLRKGLHEIPNIQVRDLGKTQCGIVSFTCKKKSAQEIGQTKGPRK